MFGIKEMKFHIFFFTVIAIFSFHYVIAVEFQEFEKNCNNIQCNIVNNYINKLNKYDNACNDAYSNVCKEDETVYRKQLLEDGKDIINKPIELHKSILNCFEDVTHNESHVNELKSLNIERKLFYQCMKLGEDEDSAGTNITKSTINSLMFRFSEMLKKDTWQTIDQEMYSLGFGYSFFDISIIKNPTMPNNNIILLQPPYVSSMLFGRLRDILYGFTLKEKEENSELIHIQKFIEFLAVMYANNDYYDKREESLNEIISLKKWEELYNSSYRNFVNYKMNYTKILEDFMNANSKNERNSTVDKGLSILKLYSAMSSLTPNYIIKNFMTSQNLTYITENSTATAKIKWTEIIRQMFGQLNITINDDEFIFVKNKPFFINLAKLLATTPNNIIAGYIIHKFKYKHLRYTDWNQVQSMEDSLNKLQFCNFETKLYGASYKLLRLWEKDTNIAKRRRQILSNIVDVTKSKILKLPTLSKNRTNYLLSEVDAITKNLLENNWNESAISNYYDDFHITESYFVNIITYRRILKNKELGALRHTTNSNNGAPVFSLVDSADLQGQFILNMYLDDIKMQNGTKKLVQESFLELPKEMQYGAYGVKLANYLYLLLNEEVLDRGGISSMVNYFKIQHLTYPHEILACFDKNYKEKLHEDFFSDIFRSFFQHWYSINEIVQTFGLSVAYEAMQKDDNKTSSEKFLVTPNQLFFLTYIKSQCTDLSMHVNRILKNTIEYKQAFQCFDITTVYENHECNITLFNVKNVF